MAHYFHFFDDTGSVGFDRHWIAELFANVAMYGYVAEQEPEQLPLLTTIVDANAEADPEQWSALEIGAMGGGSPSGYIWAQFMFIFVAERIWRVAGAPAIGHFRQALHEPSRTDDEIAKALSVLDPSVAAMIRNWPDVSA